MPARIVFAGHDLSDGLDGLDGTFIVVSGPGGIESITPVPDESDEVEPICDYCGVGVVLTGDWDGETGCHISCQEEAEGCQCVVCVEPPPAAHKARASGPVHAMDCEPCKARAEKENLPWYMDLRSETYWSA